MGYDYFTFTEGNKFMIGLLFATMSEEYCQKRQETKVKGDRKVKYGSGHGHGRVLLNNKWRAKKRGKNQQFSLIYSSLSFKIIWVGL